MALSTKQKGVARGMAAAVAVTLIVFAAVIFWQPAGLIAADTLGTRLAFALKVDIVLAGALALTIGSLARHRFFSPADIDGGGMSAGSDHARVLQAILQNTHEQVVLAVLAHLIWAAAAPVTWLGLIPAAVVLFVIGRILFWRGYAHGAPARAAGFALTFYPSVLMLVIAAVFAIAGS